MYQPEVTTVDSFRTRYMKTPENFWGVELPNGTWNGVMGAMARREAEVSSVGLVATSGRMRVVDFLAPITQIK